MTRRHALALTIPALALGIALAGCGDGGTPSTASPTTDANRQADGWDEDIIVKPEHLPACSPNCANADLRGQDMSYAPLGLNQVNLEGADLRGADISGASMAGIRLAKANLGETRVNEQQAATQNRKLGQLTTQRERQVAQIRTERKTYEAAAAELEKTAKDIQRLLARLERQRQTEDQRRRAGGRTAEPYTGDFARARKRLDWPVEGSVVGRFGPERHPRFGTTTLNNGIDIAAAAGTAVRAVARGRVDFTSDDFAAFGQVIVVNHGNGYYTLYGHLSEILVRQEQEVTPGQTIGRVGDSGTSLKGTVLHFEVRNGASALDPEDWLR